MLSIEDNAMLTRTSAGTPMGDLFRRFWIPVLLAEQLPEPDGPQVRVKVMGEALLAFRDTEGRIGLIEPRCPHRGANLFFGRNEKGGIRCAFHGWKFDVGGHCVDIPIVDPDRVPGMLQKAHIRAYPAREWGGMVWAYMGPPGRMPELPAMEFALVPPSHRHVSKKFQECNWAQAAEGGLDTAHFSFLHQPVGESDEVLRENAAQATKGFAKGTMSHDHVRWMRDDPRPTFDIVKHDAGMVLGTSRHAEPGSRYWRIAQFLMPCHGYTPSATAGQTYHAQTWVPIDDHNCWVYVYSWNPDRPITDQEREGYRKGGAVYSELGPDWMPIRNRGNDYLLDRALQKTGNFTGITGVSEQDGAIQDSQGWIADRTRELLGATDIGVVQFRRLMLEAAKGLRAGVEPSWVAHPDAYLVRAGGIVAPDRLSFAEVMALRFGDPLGRPAKAAAGQAV